jgi:hypothetical protein
MGIWRAIEILIGRRREVSKQEYLWRLMRDFQHTRTAAGRIVGLSDAEMDREIAKWERRQRELPRHQRASRYA